MHIFVLKLQYTSQFVHLAKCVPVYFPLELYLKVGVVLALVE